jgi:NADH:ubiquinone oxidoreductase subunit E
MNDIDKLKLIDDVIEEYEYKESNLIVILHIAQNLYGYLPIEVQEHIAITMNIPLSKVSGVISFYALFNTMPKGKYQVKVCLGTACSVRGGKRIIEKIKQILGIEIGETSEDMRYSLEITRCIGACG